MKTLLLLHGALGSATQTDALQHAATGYDLILAPDLNGHGAKATETETDFGIEAFTDQVLQLLDEHQVPAADIFGYSMGGYVALWLALNHPDRVGSIMTLATKFNWTPESAAREVKMLDAEKIEQKVPAFATQLASRHGESWKTVLKQTAGMMLSLGNKPLLTAQELERISNKVLIAVGDRDAMVSIEESAAAFRSLPNAQFLVLPATPHPLEKVNTDRLAWEMARFFAAPVKEMA